MTPCLRFAPSPTGWMHLGNARTALMNWLFALKEGGTVLLRLDDTDRQRSRPEYVQGIQDDLAWLGLSYSGYICQGDRIDHYIKAADFLKSKSLLYPCWETPEELDNQRRLAKAQSRPYRYTPSAVPQKGRKPHWRFRLQPKNVIWQDLVQGLITIPANTASDPVVIREDDTVVYLLASVVDDLALGITHVLRGQDHVSNTAAQIQLLEALGGSSIIFGHFPWIVGPNNEPFSKRLQSLSLKDLRQQNISPWVVISKLATLGTSAPPQLSFSLEDFAKAFDLKNFGRTTPQLHPDELWNLNTQFLHTSTFEIVTPHIRSAQLPFDVTAEVWQTFQGNIQRIEDLKKWQSICYEEIPSPSPWPLADLCLKILKTFNQPWDSATWEAWVEALQSTTNITRKEICKSLRQILTGEREGPEMKVFLPLIKPDRVYERLLSAQQSSDPEVFE